ncbi:PREDICTED: scarecrow-like protein 22 [Nelumbo nucifera]|uniref:Scarecrow-like protein 22 n=1 Tax=Nelumbo nucifera TaxID=4432 RepID=A0A1U8Q7Z6_NELNU|nr:PREDICTED: scarecrow-like protein 22 [Nelumbo nucifera]
MRGMPFNLQGKGVLEVAEISPISGGKWKDSSCLGSEPTSVLDTRRSPSPPTSTSTLSSSLGGGGSTDTAGVAAVSDNPTQKWPPTQQQEDSSAAVAEPGSCVGGGGGSRKDEWASELQPIPTALEIVNGGATGVEKCVLGMEDWESMLSESASSPSQEQSLLRWIMGDVDDPSSGLKHLLQGGGSSEFEGNAGGFGIVDQGFALESVGGGASVSGNVMGTINPSLAFPGSICAPNNLNGRAGSVPNTSALPNYKVPCFGLNNNSNPPNPINLPLPISFPPGMFFQQSQQQQPQLEPADEKPQLFNPPQVPINQQQAHHPQNPTFFMPLPYTQQEQHLLPPQPKRYHATVDPSCQIPKVPFSDSGQELFLRRQQQQQQQGFPPQLQLLSPHLPQRPTTMATKPKVVGAGDEVAHQHQQQQALIDQLFKAAELVEAGNSVHARGILARLNHQLSPVGKPLQRAAFYFKEALQLLLLSSNNMATSPPPRNSTHFDVVLKIGAYKAFSEISPLLQFANFTCNQALLDVLLGFDRIHIMDFDIGIGAQWSSFMQELASRGAPSLKITAFASQASHDALELVLTRENLTHFANDLGIAFELDIVNLDSFDPASWSLAQLHVAENEAVAVNLPVGSSSAHPSSVPSLLRFVKQLSPKIVVSVDRGCDRSDLPFSHHFLHALQSFSVLLDSLDAVNVNSDAVHKIEKFLLQPRIESIVLGRQRAPEKMPPWRNLFASAGFSPLPFTNFAETQAEYLVKRLQVRGFHVEKRQASLILYWQRRELVSASAWKC